jgi:hypothetical protein
MRLGNCPHAADVRNEGRDGDVQQYFARPHFYNQLAPARSEETRAGASFKVISRLETRACSTAREQNCACIYINRFHFRRREW